MNRTPRVGRGRSPPGGWSKPRSRVAFYPRTGVAITAEWAIRAEPILRASRFGLRPGVIGTPY
jgi:hypothetical protein